MKCLFCNDEFKKNEKNYSPNVQKFCKPKCRNGYNARNRYNKLKGDKDFKDKRRATFNNWYKRNSEKHRERVLTKYYKNKGRSVLIIGCGTENSGLSELSEVLNKCNNTSITLKKSFTLPELFDLDKLKEKLKSMDLTKKYTGDIDKNYINYISYLIGKIKNIKIICMFTDEETKIDKELKNYYKKSMELATNNQTKFKIVDKKLLKTKEGIREIFIFCGIDESDRRY